MKNKWVGEKLAVKQFRKKRKAAHVFCQDVKDKRMQTFAQPHCRIFFKKCTIFKYIVALYLKKNELLKAEG